MKKTILILVLAIVQFGFSQTIPFSGNYKDGGSGQFTFQIKGNITLGKGVFVYEDNNNYCKVYYPISFSNVQVISITTPNGTTFSNNDLVYATNSSSYPNGIKLPVNVNSNDALYHFNVEGLGYFGNQSTKFYKAILNTSLAKNNQLSISWTELPLSIIEIVQNKVENLDSYKNASSSVEKTNLKTREYEKMFKAATSNPKITNIIFAPSGQPNQGNLDLKNLMQLAQEAEKKNTNNSVDNTSSSNSTSNKEKLDLPITQNTNNNSQKKNEIIGDGVVQLTNTLIQSGIFKSNPKAAERRQKNRKKRRQKLEKFKNQIEDNKKETLSSKIVTDFSEGLAVKRNEKGWFGYVNEEEEWVIKPKYLDAEPFINGEAKVVTKFGEEIKINLNGKKL